jgi:hypothetical protein
MKPTLHNILSEKNAHVRDSNIQFFEEGHQYIILTEPDVKYTSVTTWVHSHFPKFDADKVISSMMKGKGWKEGHKYWGMNEEQIKSQWNSNKDNVSLAGTHLHYDIECFNNNNIINYPYTNKELYENYIMDNIESQKSKSIEWNYYINFIKDFSHLKPYRTEWIIYNEDVKISGSIDMVYENPDGSLSIYDWKRCRNITRINTFNRFALSPEICHLPDSNFWLYALQLNIYKYILEKKYDKKIQGLFLVQLHPENEENNYELITIPNLSVEIRDLFLDRKNSYINFCEI